MMHVGTPPSPRFWMVTTFAFTVSLSPLLVHFATEYPRRKSGVMWLVLLWYGIALIFEVGNLLGKMVERVELIPASGGVVNIEFGPMMTYVGWPYMALTIFVMAALFIHSYRSTNSRDERLLLRYPLAGILFLFGGGLLNIFPALTGYPFDLLVNIAFAMLIAYAISKHQFLNIRIVLRRNLAHVILILLLSALFVLILRLIEGILSDVSGFYLWLIMVPIATAITLVLFVTRNRLQSMIDHLFFGKRYDYRETLLAFSQKMGNSLKLNELAESLLKILCDSLNCNKASLLLPSTHENFFELRTSVGLEDRHLHRNIRIMNDDPLVTLARTYRRPLSRAEIEIMAQPGTGPMYNNWAEALSCNLTCPLVLVDNIVGFIILGPKRSGEQYSDEDILLILTISHQVAVAIENARLYAESQQMYAELKQAQENLIQSERMHALGQMTSGIAHDFNNILTTILGRVQLTLRRMKDGKSIRNLRTIEQAATDAAAMVRRLQDFARLRTDRPFDIIDLNSVINDALEMIRPRLDEQRETLDADVQLTVDLGEIRLIKGDSGELRETLVNILINAIEAMPNGGKLSVSSKQKDNFAVISLSDTGVGMTEDVRRSVFVPFFTTKGAHGLGMGLSIAYSTITRHGGELTVSSRPQEGSTFNIRIPVTKRNKLEAVKIGAQTINHGGATILVTDDDKGCRNLLYEILAEYGYKVDTATSGKECLSLAKRRRYDLALVDLGMPDISGLELATQIKEFNSKTKVILITGWGVQLNLTESKMGAISAVIAKPFRSEDVLANVGQLLGSKALPIEPKMIK